MKRPSFQFYPNDWRADSSLSMCSLLARGLWVELLCLMHELGQKEEARYGYLELGGEALKLSQIAKLVGEEEKLVEGLLEELGNASVFSRDKGVIFSRRFVRDGALREERKQAGSKGGSKTQAKFKQISSKGARTRERTEDEDEDEEEERK